MKNKTKQNILNSMGLIQFLYKREATLICGFVIQQQQDKRKIDGNEVLSAPLFVFCKMRVHLK